MRGRVFLIAVLLMALLPGAGSTASAAERSQLDRSTLLGGAYRNPVDFSAYAPGAGAAAGAGAGAGAPSHRFEGTLRLSGKTSTRTVLALDGFIDARDVESARSLPQDLEIGFVQQGDSLIPAQRGPIPSRHPWWEFVFEAGKVWDEPADAGWSRAAVPFALVQRNANCTHNGVLMFLFNDRSISRAAVQIGSETCHYLQFDLWGLLDARYQPQTLPGRDALIAAHTSEVAARLAVRPMSRLAEDHPGVDPAVFAIGAPAARSTFGVLVGGIHYRGGCDTRHGAYPFCDVLDIPSYSVAKSAVGGLSLMRMERLYPGIAVQPVSAHARATGCRSEKWQGVQFLHLLDMATGQYDSPAYMADEDSARIQLFLKPDDHPHRLAFACEAYPGRDQPGTRFVYHTSDTYLLGTVLQNALRRIPGREKQDIFEDVLWADVLGPIGMSQTAHATRRSYDAFRQPFFGWGLTLLPDDIARLARFLGEQQGRIDGKELLAPGLFRAAMQRDPDAPGLPVPGLERYRYQHGFWARNVQRELGCANPTWVPFMSGFGGITVVMFPNDAVWYSVADDGLLASIDFAAPAREVAKFGSYCR